MRTFIVWMSKPIEISFALNKRFLSLEPLQCIKVEIIMATITYRRKGLFILFDGHSCSHLVDTEIKIM